METCFRWERAAQILEKGGEEFVTAKDIAILASSHKAGRKGCPPYAQYTVVLNKADSASKREAALEVCRELNVRGVENIVVTSLHSKKL